MKAFWQLLRKELLAQRWAVGILLGLSFVWHLLLYSKIGIWYSQAILSLGLIPFFFIHLWILWISIQLYRTEWAEDTAYLLLSLPVSSWLITGVKLLTVVLYTCFSLLVIAASYFTFFRGEIISAIQPYLMYLETGWYKRDLINIGLILFIFFVGSIMLIHFSYICSRMVNRLRGLVLIWVFLLSNWVCSQLANLIEPLLNWLPTFGVDLPYVEFGNLMLREYRIPSSPFVSYILVVFGLFALGNWLWEKQIELA